MQSPTRLVRGPESCSICSGSIRTSPSSPSQSAKSSGSITTGIRSWISDSVAFAAQVKIAQVGIGPSGPFEARGKPTLVGRSPAAADSATARALWDLSERLTGVAFGLGRPAAAAA